MSGSTWLVRLSSGVYYSNHLSQCRPHILCIILTDPGVYILGMFPLAFIVGLSLVRLDWKAIDKCTAVSAIWSAL